MKTFKVVLLTVGSAGLFALACGGGASDPTLGEHSLPVRDANGNLVCDDAHKVLICHIPPGNPANAHEICVGKPAEKAHVKHGDTLAECAPSDGGTTTPPAEDAGTPENPPADAGTPGTPGTDGGLN